MGFWNNLADEAGKKTGKALGNMVFGKNAEEKIGVRTYGDGGNNGGDNNRGGGSSDYDKYTKIVDLERREQVAIDAKIAERREMLEKFYDSFEFNLSDSVDIENKSMKIISWLDTVDRKFNDKPSEYYDNDALDSVKIYDDNKSKEQALMKKLALAVDRLRVLNGNRTNFEFIEGKYLFYVNRQKEEADKIRLRRRKILKITGIVFAALLVITAVLLLVLLRPNPVKDGDACKAKVIELISLGKCDEACGVFLSFDGWYGDDDFNSARALLCEALLAKDMFTEAARIFQYKYSTSFDDDKAADKMVNYLIEQCKYDDAYEYALDKKKYVELCVKHMCQNGKSADARKFAKRQSVKFNDPTKLINDMNVVINSYQ